MEPLRKGVWKAGHHPSHYLSYSRLGREKDFRVEAKGKARLLLRRFRAPVTSFHTILTMGEWAWYTDFFFLIFLNQK